MKLIVLAVSKRQPAWIETGWQEYAKRLPPEMPLSLIEIKPEVRTRGKTAQQIMAAEAQRLRSALPPRALLIVLDEHGSSADSLQLAAHLRHWAASGQNVALIIGGADGLDEQLKNEAHMTLRLSSLTLPHGLTRILLAEALYRAASILQGHPYHRS